ncbi:glycosyltransferase family 39 protein [Amycolatopsis mediterranei]|uniref:ArnT family glycosyltransferase n=1 Tax=Amycolatopsis mediterranei TaxID=33910 RepID=UPI00343E418B
MATTVPDIAAGDGQHTARLRPSHHPANLTDRLRRWSRGRDDDPRWARPALLVLLAVTGALYVVDLAASGWANQFYAAAVQAGTKNWEAFLYGSTDAANSITADKPPASLWLTGIFVRAFGLSPWTVLIPQALAGVATVAVLYAAVRRRFSPAAGLIAGSILALTPVAALMFRFNNPDALLALLLTVAGYAGLRAQENARTRWLVLSAFCVGFAFLTKTLQAFLIAPGLAITYLAFAPTGIGRRVRQLLIALLTIVAASGWWVLLVQLIPAEHRPYVGGSQHNDFLELTFGYNGFGRLNGVETGAVGTPGLPSWGGPTGLDRLFRVEFASGIAWLLPAAFLLLAAGLWATRRAPRTDPARAAFVLWGLGLLTTFVVFSEMKGIFHPYYNVALAPYIAAVVGMGSALLWEQSRREDRSGPAWAPRAVLAAVVLVTVIWGAVLLNRTPDWLPWLRYVAGTGGAIAAAGLLLAPRRRLVSFGALGLVATLAGPAAYTLSTVSRPHEGALPGVGPAAASTVSGGMAGADPSLVLLLNGSKPGPRITALLRENAENYTWTAAAIGSQNAAGYQLATDRPVMTVGGFNRSDPAPTLERFRQYVQARKIHYFIGGNVSVGASGSSDSARIASWVEENYPATTVDQVTVYDLTSPVPHP